MPKNRSPAYPGIPLDTAIQRARQLHQAEGANWADVGTILSDWDYKSKSGAALVTLAAMGHFGLLEFEGAKEDRRGRLTDLAVRIVLDEREDSTERDAAIREAALLPRAHRELWEQHRETGLPSDANLEWQLVRERGFTPNGAKEFIKQFRRTITFARLEESATVSNDGEDRGQNDGVKPGADVMSGAPAILGNKPDAKPDPPTPDVRQVQLTIPGQTSWGTFSAPLPLTEEQWALILAQLEIHKQTWVQSSPSE